MSRLVFVFALSVHHAHAFYAASPNVMLRRTATTGRPRPVFAASTTAEVSQAEDLVANAKSLLDGKPMTGQAAIRNVLSGATVSLAMIPEAVAFAFVAGVSPIVGLQTAAVMGFFAATFGGRGGIVTGASGACAVVVTALVASHGTAYLSLCVLLAGLLQVTAGVMNWGA